MLSLPLSLSQPVSNSLTNSLSHTQFKTKRLHREEVPGVILSNSSACLLVFVSKYLLLIAKKEIR